MQKFEELKIVQMKQFYNDLYATMSENMTRQQKIQLAIDLDEITPMELKPNLSGFERNFAQSLMRLDEENSHKTTEIRDSKTSDIEILT